MRHCPLSRSCRRTRSRSQRLDMRLPLGAAALHCCAHCRAWQPAWQRDARRRRPSSQQLSAAFSTRSTTRPDTTPHWQRGEFTCHNTRRAAIDDHCSTRWLSDERAGPTQADVSHTRHTRQQDSSDSSESQPLRGTVDLSSLGAMQPPLAGRCPLRRVAHSERSIYAASTTARPTRSRLLMVLTVPKPPSPTLLSSPLTSHPSHHGPPQ